MTVNELMSKIAERVRCLADLKMSHLRSHHPDAARTKSNYETNQVTDGLTRGEIIAAILLEEFRSEPDREIGN